jgi:acetyl-CoA carboxylase biotin carboxyl carrier protein
VDLKDIKAIIDLMKKNSISEFELEKEGFKIKLRRGANGPGAAAASEDQMATAMPASPAQLAVPSTAAPAGPQAAAKSTEQEVKSPMIGTFYRAPSPDSAPYVDLGTQVEPDTVVCIIEAMKVMNEIKAEIKGVITQVLIENAKPVEFGQPLFRVRPA